MKIEVPTNLMIECDGVPSPRVWMTEEYLQLVWLAGYRAAQKDSAIEPTPVDLPGWAERNKG